VEVINTFKEMYGVPLVEGYGLSEASPGSAVNPRWGIQKVGTIGLPLPGIEMKVVDERGYDVPVKTPGELCIKGENVMKGYWNQPEETAKAIVNDWLHTGDVAIKDEDGYYRIVDRIKDLIITKGMNVYPREIEELLHHYKGIMQAAVVGVPDKDGSEVVIGYVKPEEGATLKETDIKEYLKEHLAAFKIPRRIIFTQDIPLTASGKVMKKELQKRYIEGNK
jgi:long-chain acyl-CoA synthetase